MPLSGLRRAADRAGGAPHRLGCDHELVRVMVTGAAGFIGSHLVDRLVHGGHQVAAVDDLSSGREANLAGALTILFRAGVPRMRLNLSPVPAKTNAET